MLSTTNTRSNGSIFCFTLLTAHLADVVGSSWHQHNNYQQLQKCRLSFSATKQQGQENPRHAVLGLLSIKRTQDDCIVREMLWLISERNPESDVFSWNNNTAGVTREMMNNRSKRAAIETGILGADVSSHLLRATGLLRSSSAKPASGGPTDMQSEQAKGFGHWKKECTLRYF